MGCYVVIGGGKSGMAAVSYLVGIGADVVLSDRNTSPEPALVAELASMGVMGVWGAHPLTLLDECVEVVLSPGVPPSIEFVQKAHELKIPVIGELELGHRVLRARNDGSVILGVTGTNGKSTTTDLLAHLLRRAGLPAIACGNLGTPLLEAIGSAEPGTRFALECSSYQLETIRCFHAEGAVLLNLTPDHLARHGSMEAYLDAKLRIFERQDATHLRLTPAMDPTFDAFAPGHGHSARFGWGEPKGQGAWCHDDALWLVDEDGQTDRLVHRDELKIPGRHNVENALAASVLARCGGASIEAIREGLRSYPGLAHRIAFVGEKNGIKAYNDSKGTNVDATLTAIHALPGPLVLLLGGEDKGSSYEPLKEALNGKLRHLLFLGDAIPQLERDLGDIEHTSIRSFDDAVAAAFTKAQAGDQVLLSPACASFDQFRNFEERGDHFQALVKAWMRS